MELQNRLRGVCFGIIKKKTEVYIRSCLPGAAVLRQEGKLRNIRKRVEKVFRSHLRCFADTTGTSWNFGKVSNQIYHPVLFWFIAALARLAVESGAAGIISAGGETSGAVTKALNQKAFWINESVAPGVPVMTPMENRCLRLILKSGNFGNQDFFEQALGMIEERNLWTKH